ncbi:MAG TPA: SulP family inorganic anion transporter [Lacipirellulaceae bacterium]|jgi:SulP family sulfate permease
MNQALQDLGADSTAPPLWREILFRNVPALESLRRYSLSDLTSDTMAGLTVAAVAVPQAMAYAQIANIPPQYGLYTAIVMTAVGALLDSSKQLINGPTNAISIAVLSALVGFSDAERVPAVILLALMVGVVQTAISLLRLGDLTRYVSHAVIIGFTLGASVLLVMDQLKNLLGLTAAGTGEDHFLKRFWLTMSHIDQTNYYAVGIGLATVAIALALRWVNWRFHIRLPDLLLAVIAATAIVGTWQLDNQGLKIVGDIPPKLPSFDWPQIDWNHVHTLASNSLAIALLGLLEAISMAKAIAAQTRQKLDINQQCMSEGVANLVGSMFHCFPGSGSLTRSTINQQAGGRTQWSGVISAVAVALTVLLFAPYAHYIPRAALAGILMLASYRLVDWPQLAYYLRTTRFDRWIVILTALSAVAVSVEFCVLIGVFLSFVLYVPQAARVRLTELVMTPERVVRERGPADVPCSRIRVYSLEGEFFFGASPELEEHFELIGQTVRDGARVIVLRLKRIRNPDAVCMGILDRFIDQMHNDGVTVLFCGVRPDLMKVFESSGLARRLGKDRVFVFEETGKFWSSTLEAIQFAYQVLGDDVCETCPRNAETLDQMAGWTYLI